jgi:hypothetical protein
MSYYYFRNILSLTKEAYYLTKFLASPYEELMKGRLWK